MPRSAASRKAGRPSTGSSSPTCRSVRPRRPSGSSAGEPRPGRAGGPQGGAAIDWKLITDLPIGSPEEAVEKLGWYARRWKIELFHKILKSGCRAEEARLRSAERAADR